MLFRSIERAKSHAINSSYRLGRVTELQAMIWREERRLEEAKSGALRAASVYGKIGATKDVEDCRELLQEIEQEIKDSVTSGEPRETVPLRALVNSPFSAQGSE